MRCSNRRTKSLDDIPDSGLDSPFCWYFIKPVVYGNSVDGEPSVIRATSDQKPDAIALYCLPQQVSWKARNRRLLSLHSDHKQAHEAMTQHINEDKAIHLLGGTPPEPSP